MLGPILFLVFINDLPEHIKSKVRLFADDTAVYLAVSNLEHAQILQEDLDRLRRNIRTKDSSIREVAYKTLVRPILEYSSPVWSQHTKSNIHKIEIVQMRAARWTLCRFSSYDSVSDMLGDLWWRYLEDMRTDSRLCLFYKIEHDLVAVPLPPYVVHTQVIYKTFSTTSISI